MNGIIGYLIWILIWFYVLLKLYVIDPILYTPYKFFFSYKIPACVFTPIFSPDDKYLLFMTRLNIDYKNSIYLYNLETKKIMKISDGDKPFFSGDGNKIFFLQNTALYVVDINIKPFKIKLIYDLKNDNINNIKTDYFGKNIYFDYFNYKTAQTVLTKLNLKTFEFKEIFKIKTVELDNFIINKNNDVIAINESGYDWNHPSTKIKSSIIYISSKDYNAKILNINLENNKINNPSLIYRYDFDNYIYINNYQNIYKINLSTNKIDFVIDYFNGFNTHRVSLSNDLESLIYLKDYFFSSHDIKKTLYKLDIKNNKREKIDINYLMLKNLKSETTSNRGSNIMTIHQCKIKKAYW